jgi:predicted nucleotidyltransferase
MDNRMPEKTKEFFRSLSEFLNTKLYFFGSINRIDYIPEQSDIDVCIFTDNIYSMKTKMMQFLKVNKKDFKKVIWRLTKTNRMAYGYKCMYKNKREKITAEFSIYEEKVKHDVLEDHYIKSTHPFIIYAILYLMKIIYYKFGLMSRKTFKKIKAFFLNTAVGIPTDDFSVIKDME